MRVDTADNERSEGPLEFRFLSSAGFTRIDPSTLVHFIFSNFFTKFDNVFTRVTALHSFKYHIIS